MSEMNETYYEEELSNEKLLSVPVAGLFHCISVSVKSYAKEAVEHLLLGTIIYILLCILLYVCIAKWEIIMFQKNVKNPRRVLFVIAHPDDECMFFGPTILNFTKNNDCLVYLMCLSTGMNYGMGKTRKDELYRSCKVLGIDASNIFIHNHTLLPDCQVTKWPAELVANLILNQVESYNIDTLITFDKHGISSHINHCSIYYAIAYMCLEKKLPTVMALFEGELIEYNEDDDDLEVIQFLEFGLPHQVYNRNDFFDILDDNAFQKRFRLSKQCVIQVLEAIQERLQFLTDSGVHLQIIEDYMGMHKATVSRIIKRVSEAIATNYRAYIKFPERDDEERKTHHDFFQIAAFPRCIPISIVKLNILETCALYFLSFPFNQTESQEHVTGVYVLDTVNVIRKYMLFLDVPISFILSQHRFMLNSDDRQLVVNAMKKHKSQLLWFRRLYLIFSRYTLINTLQEMDITDIELDLELED